MAGFIYDLTVRKGFFVREEGVFCWNKQAAKYAKPYGVPKPLVGVIMHKGILTFSANRITLGTGGGA